ncbi:HlyD family type I secretion periplasmic adaptor subunit [Marinagarivorans algicola]|uniref:HlyD family type I secretion periplasmic adaptor subunit n=1 Tax=Marinagarivorans algicola TaxID=1513270 RepID=UPI0006B448FD|nr:HlyD family type I secretion periplasmic adaptor subunit [Marinagarivorans algicola]
MIFFGKVKQLWSGRTTIGDAHKARERAAFLPSVLGIQECPPHPIAQWLARALLLLFVLVIAWACIGQVDIVASAEGKIIPSQRVKQIQSLEKAMVKKILVSEGEFVSEGQALIELDSTLAEADTARLEVELKALIQQEAVSRTFLDLISLSKAKRLAVSFETLPWQKKDPNYKQLLWRQWQDHSAERLRLNEGLKRNYSEQLSAAASITKLSLLLPIIEKRVKKLGALHDKNYISEIDFLAAEQERIQISQDLISERHRKNQLQAAEKEIELQLGVYIAQLKSKHWQLIVDAKKQIEAIGEELKKAQDIQRKRILYSPVDGYIQQLATNTIGGVVTDAQVLMLVVPKETVLEVEVMLTNKDIGFVQKNMSAEVKIHTFPFTKYGLVEGTVKTISNDAIVDEQLGLVYSVRVSMNKNFLNVNGVDVLLMPGMAVTAEMQIGKRRIIEFIAAPLLRGVKESLRER